VNEKWLLFKSTVLDIINKLAPLKRKIVKAEGNRTSWFDDELRNLQRIRDHHYS
jgi:hypothetical protein